MPTSQLRLAAAAVPIALRRPQHARSFGQTDYGADRTYHSSIRRACGGPLPSASYQ
jgi:hypothetical protein